MSTSKSYLLFEIMEQLKERHQLSIHEVEEELQKIVPQEPRYLIIAGEKTVKLPEKEK